MPEQTHRSLSHFTFYRFSETFYSLSSDQRKNSLSNWWGGLSGTTSKMNIYQVYPAHADADILVWSAAGIDGREQVNHFFTEYARKSNLHRHLIQPVQTLWGFTRPSEYTKTRSTQEIDPYAAERKPYLVIYPFVKTTEWYLMSKEARQGMMNEHIRIGKQFPEITQLLLYSFGLQDQEFIVVYETDDLSHFSNLVYELRSSEARRYTLRDTPVYTAIYHLPKETLALWA
jgi:chlorite dismutase